MSDSAMTWTLIITTWMGPQVGYVPVVSTGFASHSACDRAGHETHLEYLRRHHSCGWQPVFEWKCVEAGR